MEHENHPKILYHYTSAEGLLGILSNKELWATKITYLNDSKELEHAIDICKSHVRALELGKAIDSKLSSNFISQLDSLPHANVCICSFTEVGDLLSQWRAYCGDSNGYSIGIQRETLQEIGSKTGFILARCIYDLEQQNDLIIEFVDKQIKKIKNNSTEESADNFQIEFLKIAALMKDNGFKEEKEWRLISDVKNTDDEGFSFRASKTTLIPFFKIPLTLLNLKFGVDEIIVGPTPNPRLAHISAILFYYKCTGMTAKIEISKIPYRKL